ncbi:2-C-methyl-D-erythritol 2,4-cyclodiphosphate synthase [Gimesia maris]|jgi:2-C-methyl-D-erythritol 2,4-cyclodiphosphate synthase|uniref:2-C-methyl-D-erythritol 2,4-cyclodiphosphate synthase n=1 Tax=Gimesia maris TaxID=122 RepID=A0A3D3RAP3_9PLAN|nr:2-C-methyl-D-erythritol 2,4-cyclodiphosphate synthase [Gimesia maris]MAC53586.1 2-C-methyl-D-erythritol 2,4-cyclodiphosphate synthase [Gimesia sp.]HAW27435.1 2-C-methyl-D-erythritol 2,4-cyclodiphosphate synthase [Planctomycetaceae bacterium]EDL59460.1 2-C-methyl-D-erythritol 2,4-cyclodiphosphate synthase [Gimesia maris DSM 8797]QDU13256.1 2-C-methyl-D-erythritol 2,4-cyclodiphosphate synthase [Gimesia maris]QEG15188.1 2-C-methyl-D-erythritol 2,4-cyclodiphosphate synthase [Gimesia maris]|tara:strand:- start:5316 stop:5828 length:513 start_codon:yes stop_codon:yes gene_type:complete
MTSAPETRNNPELRIGAGQDCHRLEAGFPLILGGVSIEFDLGLVGHSDADVLLHAITDALLGAAGLGDIGEMFPNTDDRWKGADSGDLLKAAFSEVEQAGWQIVNLDCTISAERPKLASYKPQIRKSVARLLNLDEQQVNIKAKTGERVGPVGRQEAMTADAVVLLTRSQ